MKILSLHNGHNATAAFMENGVIKHCISEERFCRIKNKGGFPKNAIEYILKDENISASELDSIVISGRHPTNQFFNENIRPSGFTAKIRRWLISLENSSKIINKLYVFLRRYFGFHRRAERDRLLMDKKIAEVLGVSVEKILRFDHHLCHAATVYYGLCDQKDRWLVITVDGGGDEVSATINIAENGDIKPIAKTPVDYSLGCFYSAITEYMGMKPLEHEYKVMGLAPYASDYVVDKTYQVLKKLIWLNKEKLAWESQVRNPFYADFIEKNLWHHRFDQVAGATQKLTEELLVDLLKSAVAKTGIKNIALSGGVFMNVKANMRLAQLAEVDKLEIFPSCGDESLPIGAAYLYAVKSGVPSHNLKQITDLYFGTGYNDEELRQALKNFGAYEKYAVSESSDVDAETAKLLAENKIVARFCGRSEWGARALGNRSIMANASNQENIKIINEQIKGRDFWMPFAASVLIERSGDYLVNPKNISAPYMIMAFTTKPLAKEHLRAGLHPYDLTCRPQIVEEKHNPSYYRVLKEYEKLTGMGGFLNTSFNLHGEPLVESPTDALKTFEQSGLRYLVLENFIISKK